MINEFFDVIQTYSKAKYADKSFMEQYESLLKEKDVTAHKLLKIANEIYVQSDKEKYIGLLEVDFF